MPGKTNDLSKKLLNHTLRATTWTSPSTVYMALMKDQTATIPNTTYNLFTASEFKGDAGVAAGSGYLGYARATVTNTSSTTVLGTAVDKSNSLAGVITNSSSPVVFPQFQGTGSSYGTVNGFMLVTSYNGTTSADTDLLYYGTVAAKLINSSNTPPTVATSALSIEES